MRIVNVEVRIGRLCITRDDRSGAKDECDRVYRTIARSLSTGDRLNPDLHLQLPSQHR